MKKFLSICLAVSLITNTGSYAVSVPDSMNRTMSSSIEKGSDKKKSVLSRCIEIGAGIGIGAAVFVAVALTANHFISKMNAADKSSPKKPMVSDEEINALQDMAVSKLREDLNNNKLQWSNVFLRNYDGVSSNLCSTFIFNVDFSVIESPKKDVSLIFTDIPNAKKCLSNIEERLNCEYSDICHSSLRIRGYAFFEDLYNRIISDGSWRSAKLKKEYVELFALYRDFRNQLALIKDSNTSAEGILVTENRSFGEDELIHYYVRILNNDRVQQNKNCNNNAQ